MRVIITSPSVPVSSSPVSPATFGEGLIFVGGQMPRDRSTGVIPNDPSEQSRLSLEHCLALVEAGGGNASSVMVVHAYLTDLEHKPHVDRVFSQEFGSSPPARHLVEVSAIGENAVVEFAMIALRVSKQE